MLPEKQSSEHFLRLEAVASQLDVEPTEVKAWAERGEFPIYRFPKDEIRIAQSDIDSWIASRRVIAGAAASAAAAITIMRPKSKRRNGQAKAVGYRLHMLRTLNGLSQPFCSDVFGLDDWKELDRYERGEKIFDQSFISAISSYYGVQEAWLSEGIGSICHNNVAFFRIGHQPIQSRHVHNYKKAALTYLPQLTKDYPDIFTFTVRNASFMADLGPKHGEKIWKVGVAHVFLLGKRMHGYLVIITDQPQIAAVMGTTLNAMQGINFSDNGNIKMEQLPLCLLNGSKGDIMPALDTFIDKLSAAAGK